MIGPTKKTITFEEYKELMKLSLEGQRKYDHAFDDYEGYCNAMAAKYGLSHVSGVVMVNHRDAMPFFYIEGFE